MKTLLFNDRLIINPFRSNNGYIYQSITGTGVETTFLNKEIPYIAKVQRGGEIVYCDTVQFNGRAVNTARIKEILDTSHYPLKISLEGRNYLIGKGFLASISKEGDIELLYIACIQSNLSIKDISQVKFYVSRKVYHEIHKKISPAIRDIILEHTGNVLITSDIRSCISEKIDIPEFKTIKEKKEAEEAVIETLIETWKKS